MKRFWTSDLHFGHNKIIDYCARPFTNLDDMHSAIVKQWNSQVGPDDLVYVLGDFSLNPKWVELILPTLNGSKILIHGNHDATFPVTYGRINKKAERMQERYIAAGFNEIHTFHTTTLYNNQEVLMAHMPYANEHTLKFDKRYLDYRPADTGSILLAGHLHGRYIKCNNMIDVSWDAHNGKLLSEDDLIVIINDPRHHIDSHITEYYKSRDVKVLE